MTAIGNPRAHVLSIRDNPEDEKIIETVWRSDIDIELEHVACGSEALDYLQQKDRKLPNLILLAWRFRASQLSAAETLSALKADAILRAVPVIVLAGHLSHFDIQELYFNGAACVIEMPRELEGLEAVMRAIKDLWLNTARLPYKEQLVHPGKSVLTDRERQIVRLMAEDLTYKEIAFRLGISEKTVEFHRYSIKKRIGVAGTAGLIRYAIKSGILEP